MSPLQPTAVVVAVVVVAAHIAVGIHMPVDHNPVEDNPFAVVVVAGHIAAAVDTHTLLVVVEEGILQEAN